MNRMGWCTTPDLDRFLATADGYLRSRAAENTLLLSAAQEARDAQAAHVAGTASKTSKAGAARAARDARTAPPSMLFGWWEPPDGSGPRGAFMHDEAAPVLLAGRAPETAASLAAALARTGRWVCGIDAPTGAADAFAAAWSQRAGLSVRVHKHSRVYRLAGTPPYQMGPAGRYRVATAADRALLVDWLTAFGAEVGDLQGAPEAAADDLLGYSGAAFWEVDGRPVALATVTPPVARTVRLNTVYTPPALRHNGYATSVMLAVSRAALAGGQTNEVVLITDRNSPDRQAARLGYQFIGERAVLRFGPATAPMQRVQTGPMSRVATGPMPRLRGRRLAAPTRLA
jgi:hypothetical protein